MPQGAAAAVRHSSMPDAAGRPGQGERSATGRPSWTAALLKGRRAHDSPQLALVIDLNVCVGCHACVTSARSGTPRPAGPMADFNPYGATRPAPSSTACRPSRSASSRTPDGALPQELPALRGSALRAGVPHRRLVQAQGGRHRPGRLRQVHRLQILLVGLPLRRARVDEHQKVMKKCTLWPGQPPTCRGARTDAHPPDAGARRQPAEDRRRAADPERRPVARRCHEW